MPVEAHLSLGLVHHRIGVVPPPLRRLRAPAPREQRGEQPPLTLLHFSGGVNHLKVSFSGRSVSAKAYPAFSLRGSRGG